MEDRYKGWMKHDFVDEVIKLKGMLDEQEIELETLRAEREYVQKLKDELQEKLSEEHWKPKKNERGAGRKPMLTRELYADIMRQKDAGNSYRQIAKSLGVSVGLVGKACNMSGVAVEQLKHEQSLYNN